MMLDLDNFKKLNDTLGHAAGDEVLKSVGEMIHSTIRDGDFGCRYGGDEFVVLLPNCEVSAAKKVGERLDPWSQPSAKTTNCPRTAYSFP